jgi:hypothetical protein
MQNEAARIWKEQQRCDEAASSIHVKDPTPPVRSFLEPQINQSATNFSIGLAHLVPRACLVRTHLTHGTQLSATCSLSLQAGGAFANPGCFSRTIPIATQIIVQGLAWPVSPPMLPPGSAPDGLDPISADKSLHPQLRLRNRNKAL